MAVAPLYTPIHLGFAITPGVHALTTRISYTVPSGRIASLMCGAMGLTEPSGIAVGSALIILTINGVQSLDLANAGVAGVWNTSFGVIDLSTAETILISTVQSVAGTFLFSGMLQIREYQ